MEQPQTFTRFNEAAETASFQNKFNITNDNPKDMLVEESAYGVTLALPHIEGKGLFNSTRHETELQLRNNAALPVVSM